MTEMDVFRALRCYVGQQKTRAAAAKALGLSPQYLNDVWHRRRSVAPLAKKLGFRKLDDRYELIEKEKAS